MHRLTLPLCLVAVVFSFPVAAAKWPDETAVNQTLEDCVDTRKKAPGMVIGFIDETGTKLLAHGKRQRDGAEVDGGTVFEIGSISKVFTSLLLADMVQRGEVKLDDPISKFLPSSVKVPTRNGREITLADLATHTSGLPRLPDNMGKLNLLLHMDNPYADYTVPDLYAFLSGYKLPRDIGAEYEYSNLGGGLLGHVLALKVGTNYEALVTQRICLPLGMTNTAITRSPEIKARLTQGHNAKGKPVPNWDMPALQGAGAILSTANDLLKFLAAQMALNKTGLLPAMEMQQAPRHEAGSSAMQIGLGWHILKATRGDIIWHNGGTGGYRSFIGFDKKKKRGVVVLANSANEVDDLGFGLLKDKSAAPGKHTAIKLDLTIYDAYLGKYQIAPGAVITISRKDNRLFARMTGQSALEIFPESETDFFLKVVDAQISFTKDTKGAVTSLILHQNGIDQEGKKLD